MAHIEDEDLAATAHDRLPGDAALIYDEDGAIKPQFLHDVTAAIEASDASGVCALAGDLHEADLGALLVALSSDLRSKLIELMGPNFDFAALTEMDAHIRDEILAELPNGTVAEGVRDLESDDAVTLLEDLDEEDQAEILEALPPVDRVQLQRSLDYPGPFRRPSDADDIRDRAAVLDRRAGDRCHARHRRSGFAGFVFRNFHRRSGASASRHCFSRHSFAREKFGQARRHHVRGSPPRRGDGGSRGGCALIFQRYNLVSVPVVDEAERLVGVITIDDVVDVIQEEADAN